MENVKWKWGVFLLYGSGKAEVQESCKRYSDDYVDKKSLLEGGWNNDDGRDDC